MSISMTEEMKNKFLSGIVLPVVRGLALIM